MRSGHVGIFLLVILIGVALLLWMQATSGTAAVQAKKQAEIDIAQDISVYGLVQSLIAYEITNGEYPGTLDDIEDLGRARLDPWEGAWTLTYEESERSRRPVAVFTSMGPDGLPDTEDDIIVREQLP